MEVGLPLLCGTRRKTDDIEHQNRRVLQIDLASLVNVDRAGPAIA